MKSYEPDAIHQRREKRRPVGLKVPFWGHPIEDVRLSNIRIYSQGGGTKEQAALDPPEKEDAYPEPTMFGELPAYGFFIRHVKALQINDVVISYIKEDARPPFVMNDVKGADFFRLRREQKERNNEEVNFQTSLYVHGNLLKRGFEFLRARKHGAPLSLLGGGI